MTTTDSALRDAVGTIRHNFWRLLVPMVAFFGPTWALAGGLILFAISESEEPNPDPTWITVLVLAVTVVGSLGYVAAQAAAQVITVDHLSGRKPNLRRAFDVESRHLGPIIGASLLGLLAYLVGLALFIVPGLIVLTGIALCFPAIMFEDLGPLEGLKRSWSLTRGNRLSVFLSFAGVYFLTGLAAIPVQLVAFGALAFVEENSALAVVFASVGLLAFSLIYVVSIMFYCVLPAIFYVRIKEEREGVDVGALAEVFE